MDLEDAPESTNVEDSRGMGTKLAVGGMLLAVLLLSRYRFVRLPARVYVDVFRGLPAIVTVSLVGIGLPAAGLRLFGRAPLGYAVLAIGPLTLST